MSRTTRNTFFLAACALALLAVTASTASATFIAGQVSITADDGFTSTTTNFLVPLGGTWTPGVPQSLGPGLGTVISLTQLLDDDPLVSLGFSVTSGPLPTNFTINSTIVSFPGIVNPSGVASAGITLTDVLGNGASATGFFPGGKAYQAVYNTTNVFASLVTPAPVLVPFSSQTTNEIFPGAGFFPIGAVVTSIQSQFRFTLSPLDMASGTSTFFITPEPSSMALALMGSVAVAWRVRRRRRSM